MMARKAPRMINGLPVCGFYNHADCAFRETGGGCKVLRDMDFGGDCKFYRSRTNCRKACPGRLAIINNGYSEEETARRISRLCGGCAVKGGAKYGD